MRRGAVVLVLSLGCGGNEASDTVSADIGEDAVAQDAAVDGPALPPDAARGCDLTVAGETRVRAGGRLQWAVSTEAPLDTVEADWRFTRADQTLTLRAPYELGTHTVQVSAVCAGSPFSLPVEVEVLPLEWSSTPSWGGDEGPIAREYFSMWIDPTDPDLLWLFGGFHYVPEQFTTAWDLWSYDLVDGAWRSEEAAGEPPRLAGGGMAPVPGEASAFYYGGLNSGAGGLPFSLFRFDYGNLTSWREQTVEDPPENGTYQPAFFFEPRRELYLAVGGQGADGTHMNVSAFDPAAGTWSAVAVEGPGPSGRTGYFWTYDPETERFIAFGGEQGGGDPGDWNCNCAQDTWALELSETPPRWVEVLPAQEPPIGRRNGTFALDPLGHRLLMWGGTANGRSTFPGLWALDLDRGHEAWVEVEAVSPPPERSSGAAVFDAARGRLLAGFGNGAAVYADLWALPLAP